MVSANKTYGYSDSHGQVVEVENPVTFDDYVDAFGDDHGGAWLTYKDTLYYFTKGKYTKVKEDAGVLYGVYNGQAYTYNGDGGIQITDKDGRTRTMTALISILSRSRYGYYTPYKRGIVCDGKLHIFGGHTTTANSILYKTENADYRHYMIDLDESKKMTSFVITE